MNKVISGIVLGGFTAIVFAMAYSTGVFSVQAPTFPSFTAVEMELTLPEEARITAVEPITLDCRARVFAEVPIEGEKEHEAFGRVYRTDRISMHAYGDVDTCVDGGGTTISHNTDGSTDVVIDGESIVFVRPRVDTVRTADSVNIDKGFIGKIMDAFPWVDDNLGLTPVAYAYAQNVIGSSECMETAYAVTQEILVDAYRQQVVEQGVDPEQLSVTIDGRPRFDDPAPLDMDDIDMRVGSGAVTCVASEELGGVNGGLEIDQSDL